MAYKFEPVLDLMSPEEMLATTVASKLVQFLTPWKNFQYHARLLDRMLGIPSERNRKTTSEEGNLKGRKPLPKINSHADNLTTKLEDDLTGRLTPEDNLIDSQPSQEEDVGPLAQ